MTLAGVVTAEDDFGARGLDALRRGDPSTALHAFAEAVRRTPEDAAWQQGLGAAALALGHWDRATEAYRAAVALDPSRVDALRGLGHSARRKGDRAEALRWFEAACVQDPQPAKHHHEVGEELRHLGRLREADEAFARALARQPQHRPTLLSRAALARVRGDQAATLEALEAVVATDPSDTAVKRDIADCLCGLGRLDEAEAAYRALLDESSYRCEVLRGLADVARRRGDGAGALARLREAAELRDEPRLAIAIAKQRIALGETADTVYSPLLVDERTRPDACIAFAAEARREPDAVRARTWLAMIAAADPSHRPTGLVLAELHRARWELDEADAVLARLAATCVNDPEVLIARGRIARMRGAHGQARRFFEQAYHLDPLSGATDLARAFRDEGDYGQAQVILERVRAQQPDDVPVLVQLGVTARAAGAEAAALGYFDRAIEIAPNNLSALLEKIATLQRLGRLSEMRRLLDRAAGHAPNHPRVLDAFADLALAADDPGGALIALAQTRPETSAPAWLRLKIARCEAALGRIEEALATIDGTMGEAGPSPDAFLLKAQILRYEGRVEEADRTFQTAAAQFPFSFQLWFQHTLFMVDTGRDERASLDGTSASAATNAERAKAATVSGVRAAALWNFARAANRYRCALQLNPGDAATRGRLAMAALCDLDIPETVDQLRHLARIEAPMRRLRGQSLSPFQTLAGQILEEARIDTIGLDRLVAAGRTPRAQRCEALAAVVRAYPDMTLAAMQLLLTLRRQGHFVGGEAAHDAPAIIPATIVQFWHADAPPPDVGRLTKTWAAFNPDFAYRRFTDRMAQTFLEREYPIAVAEAYRRVRDPARKADLFRLAYLLRCGGLYADADDRCVGSIAPVLSARARLVLYQEDIGSAGNNIMAAVPNHPLLRRALNLAVAGAAAGDNDIPWLATGPGLLTRVLAGAVAEGGPSCLETYGLRMLTRRALLPFAAIACTTAYKHTRRHWSRAAFLAPAARSHAKPDSAGANDLEARTKEAS